LKKRKKQNITLAVIATVILVAIISYNYSADQTKIKGFNFGNELQQIQDEVKKLQNDFESKTIQWQEGDLTKEQLLGFSQKNVLELETLLPKYDELTSPESFIASVDLFKLSTETQIESNRQYIKWIETGDESFKIHSDSLFQESFEYEIAALGKYKAAQQGITP